MLDVHDLTEFETDHVLPSVRDLRQSVIGVDELVPVRDGLRALREPRQRREHAGVPFRRRNRPALSPVLLECPPRLGLQVAGEHGRLRAGARPGRRVRRCRPRSRRRGVRQEHDGRGESPQPHSVAHPTTPSSSPRVGASLERPAVARTRARTLHRPRAAPTARSTRNTSTSCSHSHAGRIALLAVSGASNVTGVVQPVHALAERVHAVGGRILVDAAQLAGHRPIDMRPHEDPGASRLRRAVGAQDVRAVRQRRVDRPA